MTMQKIRLGTNDDGTPHYLYQCDGPVVKTGPITGKVTVPDGTEYDVTEEWVEVAPGHEGHVAHAIGVRYQTEGHPLHPVVPFVHECTGHCPKTKKG